jgi:hypothetical protein
MLELPAPKRIETKAGASSEIDSNLGKKEIRKKSTHLLSQIDL